ncbi:MAG: hypothetical protein AzoDbin1_00327 [Azoarcus sp.]|nr:hypothetical protein [Azoarcus sp.]
MDIHRLSSVPSGGVRHAPRRVLLIHQNFPGQFRHLAQFLARHPAYELRAVCRETAPGLPGVPTVAYRPKREGSRSTHRYLQSLEAGVLTGQAVAQALLGLKKKGWVPDVVLAHPGWGESLFVKDVFPGAKLIHFCEFFYRAEGADADFDPEQPLTLDDRARIRSRNALHLLALEACDQGVCPTQWQRSLQPRAYQKKLTVIHEGVDVEMLRPDPAARFVLPDGRVLTRDDEVVTYVARNLEPYRGFPQFMRAVEALQRQRPRAQVLIAGGDDVSYGRRPDGAPNWRQKMLQEVQVDSARTHFLGKLPYAQYLQLLKVSRAHVYLTYPFVLSWSVLEAMAGGCVVVGSDTAPVQEVLRHGENGYLVDFFDTRALVGQLFEVIEQPDAQQTIRASARQTIVQNYGLQQGIARYLQLIESYRQQGWSTDLAVQSLA